ncbi:DUF241 domain-containing protein, partial [Cephalotus follicularis]
HARSISLPSRIHPLAASIEEQLCKLKSQATSSLLSNQLGGLKELNVFIEGFLRLPLTQQALSHNLNRESVEEVLNGSLMVLDLCGTTRDVFSQMKDCLQELESSIRRRRGGQSGLESEIGAYLISRKKLNKVINKCFSNIKSMEKKCKDSEPGAVITTLKEIEEVSLTVFQSLLSSISQPKARSNWSIVSKMLKNKRVSCNEEADTNEVQKMEAELLVLKLSKDLNVVQVKEVLKGLKALVLSIQELEEEMECIFRHSLKTRASLLNILSN